jgi:hypothetical protein
LRLADGLQRQNAIGPGPNRDHATERTWIARNRATFANQWVAVEGDRLIAAGTTHKRSSTRPNLKALKAPSLYTSLKKIRSRSYRAGRFRAR